MTERIELLDHGYLQFVECWGSDERIVEAARMSTGKGFLGWDPGPCPVCRGEPGLTGLDCRGCAGKGVHPGDAKLLRYLYASEPKHTTPFEMAGMVVEAQAPIMVFREWHRHRTQCLGPDTLIHFDAPKSRSNRHYVYKMRIEDAWRKWQPTVRTERPRRQTNAFWPRSRVASMTLRSLDERASEITHTGVVDVIRGEPKRMVRVTTASGRQLTATREHRVYTESGWRCLGEAIDSRLRLTLEGRTRNKKERWPRPEVDEGKELWRPVPDWEDRYEVSTEGRARRVGRPPKAAVPGVHGYDVVSLSRGGKSSARTVHSLVLEAFVGRRPQRQEARHLNSNRADSRLANLAWGTAVENAADRVTADRQQRLVPVLEEIVAVDDAGVLPSYDLSVRGPWHNFIADGFVVHNSYNEMSARYAPLPDTNYVPSAERCMLTASAGGNKQAGVAAGAEELTPASADAWLVELEAAYRHAEEVYQSGLRRGVPKELARLCVPVGRYSRMRASACLLNWLKFMTLRSHHKAQLEIRVYSDALGVLISERFPRTWALFAEGRQT